MASLLIKIRSTATLPTVLNIFPLIFNTPHQLHDTAVSDDMGKPCESHHKVDSFRW